MKIFVKATSPGEPKSNESVGATYLYVLMLVIMVLTQLFTFDKFLVILEDLELPGGDPVAHLIGGILVVSEVLAIPFLLRMKLSPLMRIVSMVLGWLVPLIWFTLSVWVLANGSITSTVGLFGSMVQVVSAWPSAAFSIALGTLAAWTSWGLWPIKPRKSHK